MAAIGHLGQGGLEALGQLGRALAAEGAALQQHHPAAGAERGRAGLLEGLGRLAAVVAIEAAEVEAGPGGIELLLQQGLHGAVAGRLVFAPEEVDGHRVGAGGLLPAALRGAGR